MKYKEGKCKAVVHSSALEGVVITHECDSIDHAWRYVEGVRNVGVFYRESDTKVIWIAPNTITKIELMGDCLTRCYPGEPNPPNK